mmetsp:Transcript_34664/g.85294  ORF Transcript_34664/g.85294 Transcript_34664/m.85294 type:complete len:213 (-) Transcript_34664:266-904(-)
MWASACSRCFPDPSLASLAYSSTLFLCASHLASSFPMSQFWLSHASCFFPLPSDTTASVCFGTCFTSGASAATAATSLLLAASAAGPAAGAAATLSSPVLPACVAVSEAPTSSSFFLMAESLLASSSSTRAISALSFFFSLCSTASFLRCEISPSTTALVLSAMALICASLCTSAFLASCSAVASPLATAESLALSSLISTTRSSPPNCFDI